MGVILRRFFRQPHAKGRNSSLAPPLIRKPGCRSTPALHSQRKIPVGAGQITENPIAFNTIKIQPRQLNRENGESLGPESPIQGAFKTITRSWCIRSASCPQT
jgi:hypothetical protein